MGHHYYKSKHVSRSRSSHALRVVRGAADTFGYSVEDTVRVRESMHSTSISSSSGSRKAYGPDVLKHHVHGVEGQVWTNLASWTGGRVDAVDFGRKEARRVHEAQQSSSRHRDHHRHHRHKHHTSHHHHHHHQHRHTHHHYYGRDVRRDHDHDDDHRHRHRAHRDHDELSDVTRRFSRSLRIASPTRASSSPPSSSRSSPRPRSLARVPPSPYTARRPATAQFSVAGISDPPPPYSSRAGGSSTRDRDRGGDRNRASTHKSRDHGVPAPSHRSGSTSTLFSPSQREADDGWRQQQEKKEKQDRGGARIWDTRASSVSRGPDGDVRPVFGGGYAGRKGSGSGSGYARERERERERGRARARGHAKDANESPLPSYLVPGASAGTNLGQCPYLRRLHGAA